MIQALIGPLASLAGTFLENRVAKSKAESEVKIAKAKAEAKVYETETTSKTLLERDLTSQMSGSWKDEIILCVWRGGFLACFFPFSQPYVKDGFIFLNEYCPPWYSNILYLIVGASYGFRFGMKGLQYFGRKG